MTISGTAGTFEVVAGAPSLTVDAADLGVIGSGAATVEVRQIGDLSASRPAQITINLP